MSFIIWTMQRTGGTALCNALGSLTGKRVLSEPFNATGVFSYIAALFYDGVDAREELSLELSKQKPFKHCVEFSSDAFNQWLLKEANAHGYRHLVLRRRSRSDRMISREFAHQTGVWGKSAQGILSSKTVKEPDVSEMLAQDEICQNLMDQVESSLSGQHRIFFEDFHLANDQVKAAEFCRIAEFLGVTGNINLAVWHLNYGDQRSPDRARTIGPVEVVRATLEAVVRADVRVSIQSAGQAGSSSPVP